MSNRFPLYSGLLTAGVFFFAALIAPPAALAQQKPLNIAVVDLDRVVGQSAIGKELQQRLDTFQKTVQTEAERKTKQAAAIRQQIESGVNSLSQDRLADLQRDYEDANRDLQRYRDDKQREGSKMQNEGLRKIQEKLEPIFAGLRAEGTYDLILNNVPGVVIMATERADITQTVLARLDAASP